MTTLTYQGSPSITEEQLTRALTRQLGNAELARQVAQAGIHEIARVHYQATDMVAQTLATAGHMVKAASYAGHITPAKQSELRGRTEAYLVEVLGITHDTSCDVIDILGR